MTEELLSSLLALSRPVLRQVCEVTCQLTLRIPLRLLLYYWFTKFLIKPLIIFSKIISGPGYPVLQAAAPVYLAVRAL